MGPLVAMDRAMANTKAVLASARRVLLALLVCAALAAVVAAAIELGAGALGGTAARAGNAAPASTPTIPSAARAQVSAALGAARAAFHVQGTAGALHASNPVQGLEASFTSSEASVEAHGLNLSLSLRSLGFGDGARQHPLGEATPTAQANRVRYAHGAASEWYANGPAGLEQGFTIAHPPARGAIAGPAEPLTLTLALSASAKPRLTSGGTSMVLARGASELRYGGVSTKDAKGRALRTWLQLRPGRLLIQVDAAGAAYPLRVDPLIEAGTKLTASDEQGQGLMGASAALSADGSTLLVGGPQDQNPDRGAAWVFVRDGESWVQQGPKLTGAEAPDEVGEEECAEESAEEAGECAFGNSVALSADGNTALVGEPSATDRRGNVWVFTRSGGTWTKSATLSGGPQPGEGRFGKSVALSADGATALVGDPSADAQHGSAWVYALSGSEWQPQAKLAESAPERFDHFGRSVALSSDGNTALIGSPGAQHYAGSAWVFTRSGKSWSQEGSALHGAGELGEGHFGKSVALSGDGQTALVGAMSDGEGDGAVWPFRRVGGGFAVEAGALRGEAGQASHFGASIALSADGEEALVGMPHGPEGGAVAQLVRGGSGWSELGEQLVGANRTGKGWMGAAVALSGDGAIGAIGAPRDNARVGAAWVFAKGVTPPPPTVTGVQPGSGPVGTTVKVKGVNLAEASGVFFGGTPATSFSVRSGVLIEAVAPPGVGLVDVTVHTPSGTSAIDSEDTFRYTTGKAKGGGSENEEPGGGTGGQPGGSGGTQGQQASTAGLGSKLAGRGGVLGTSSSAAAACVLSLRSRRLAVTGHRTVALRLQRAGTSACSGKLTLSFNRARRGKRPRLQTIGTAAFSMGSATSKVLKIDLNKLGRRLFRSHGRTLNASLAFVRLRPAPLLARSASVRLSVKKAKKVTLAK